MNERHTADPEQLRAALRLLLQDADAEKADLLRGVDEALGSIAGLEAENERLKQEVKKLRGQLHAKAAGSMNSRLKDALRE
ncbi:hypothetical protein [Paenibacillus contaminans]|uniref:Uncharacterized protein n=1 Tax=Paenibacillus contaminans TaxID=450362 RepID=A0A329MIF6_9BACL|nr:hypothetical protein [Paenibacillus contaminans]RAV19584.1 hypothetical protein DQG23_19150 [Paenibacillus contaminans]